MGKRSREKQLRREESAAGKGPSPAGSGGRAAPVPPQLPSLDAARRIAAEPTPWLQLLRRHATAIAVLFGVSLLVRLLLLWQIGSTVYMEVANIDSDSYQQWGIDIANGNWMPKATFYQSPFYAYYLAALYKVFGVGPWSPRVSQILLGSLSPVLLYGIATRLFTRRVGWIAGAALAVYGPVILEEITLSKTSLLLVTALIGFALYLRAAPRARLHGLAWAGFFIGVSVMGVAQWLLAFLALTGWTYFMPEERLARGPGESNARVPIGPPRRLLCAAVFFAGAMVPVLPVVWWNTAHGGGLVLTSGGSGLNLYTGNNPRATALPASPRGVRDVPQFEEDDARRVAERAEGRPLLPAEVSAYWSGQATTWIRENPGDWLALMAKKIVVLWNAYEIPDNYHYSFMRWHFLPLMVPMLTFAVVAPLALLGVLMPFWQRKDLTALYIACFGYLVTPLIFYVRARYRLPAVPFLMIFAAVAVERFVRLAQARQWTVVGTLAFALGILVVFTNHTYCQPAQNNWPSVCLGGDTWYDQEWLKLTEWYERQDDLDRAIHYAERSRECKSPRSRGQIEYWLAALEAKKTRVLLGAGDRDTALQHFRRAETGFRSAIDLRHQVGAAWSGLATLYLNMGMVPEATRTFESARAAGSLDGPGTMRLAQLYTDAGRCSDAKDLMNAFDRNRGLTEPSEETRGILATCQPR